MFSRYSVKRPYTVLVGVVLVIVLGVVSLMKMTTDLLPDMSFQYALIITTDIGASPEEVEMEVTAPIEAAIATTSNIKNVTSMSYNSYSIVTCEYEQNANMDSVVIEIQQNLDQLQAAWDDSVGAPTIMKINPDMLPIMMAAVNMEGMSASEITDYVNNDLIPAIESTEGVASVTATGQLEESFCVTLEQDKIDALNKKVQKEIKDQFKDAKKDLDKASKKVDDGKQAVADGSDQMKEAVDTVLDQKDQLYKTEEDLHTKHDELVKQKESLQQVIDGINAFMKSDVYKNTIPELENAITSLESGIEQLEALQALQQGGTQMQGMDASQMPEMTPEQMQGMAVSQIAEASQGENALGDLNQKEQQIQVQELEVPQLQEGEQSVLPEMDASQMQGTDGSQMPADGGLSEMKKQLKEAKAGLNQINGEIKKNFAGLSAMGIKIETYKDLPKAAGKLGKTMTQLNTGITAIEEGLEQVQTGKVSLGDAMDALNANVALTALQMGNTSAELATAASSLETAKSTLDDTKKDALDKADMNNILTMETLSGLLVAQNFDMPAGYAKKGNEDYLIQVGDSVSSLEELENLVLMDMKMDEVGLIRLKDVATIKLQDNSKDTYAVVNGEPGLILSMEKQTGYSTGDVTDRLLDKFEFLQKENEKLHIGVLMNQGVYIDLVVDSVMQNMIFGGILAVIVLILFLKDLKPTIVIACSIPLSVIVAVVLMYFTGISLNVISMSGLVLGIGMLVDNSIVVIENIYRLRGEGYSIRKAAVEGATQVTGAIIASTLTTVSVYAPIIFTDGITKQLFVDLALTIAYTLVASLVVALTFVPAMSSAILKKTKEIKHSAFDGFKDWYGSFLAVCLRFKAVVFVLAIVLLAGSAALALSRGFTFMDMDMEAGQITVTVEPQEDEKLTFEELTDLSDQVIDKIQDIEGIETIGATAGGSSTMSLMGGSSKDSVSIYIIMEKGAKLSSAEVSEEVISRTKDLKCLVKTDSSSMDMTALMGSGLSVNIKGRDIQTLQKLAAEVAQVVEQTEGTIEVEDGLDEATPQLSISVDKEKAAKYGMTVAQVFQLVNGKMASSKNATTIKTDIKDYKVYLQSEEQEDVTLKDIEDLTFTYTTKKGKEKEIALKKICKMENTSTLSTIRRKGQTRYITVSCGIDEEHNVTLVGNEVKKNLDKIKVPEGYDIEMTGEDEMIKDSMEQMLLMLLLAVIFIYLIMVAQFQSLLSPFIIMFSIPLAFTGGFIALFITKQEVSIISMLGFIMLAGLIVNNGIVLIDYINQERRAGATKHDAIIDAGKTRMRPILMTALTTILAMSTSAVGLGEGSEMMIPMATTIIGGLVYGTVLTLVVIPCIYDAFNKEKSMVEEEL